MCGAPVVTRAVLAAWQAALNAEQQADFGYSVLGPVLAVADQGFARTCQQDHDALVASTAAAILALGAQPVPPHSDYPPLYARLTAPIALAASLEDDCAAAWRYLYAAVATSDTAPAAAGTIRRTAQGLLTASAVRATAWRLRGRADPPVSAFPGI